MQREKTGSECTTRPRSTVLPYRAVAMSINHAFPNLFLASTSSA